MCPHTAAGTRCSLLKNASLTTEVDINKERETSGQQKGKQEIGQNTKKRVTCSPVRDPDWKRTKPTRREWRRGKIKKYKRGLTLGASASGQIEKKVCCSHQSGLQNAQIILVTGP